MRIIKTECNDPAINLAFEEFLIEQKQDVIYFWQNEPTIVIGRNQNPYKECNLKKIKEEKVHLMRRRSGGGAVYHDLGNVNFTIISKKTESVINDNFNLMIKALKECGINACLNGRNDLEVEGKKISGSAFYEEDDIYCHHGTLLVNTDMTKLSQYLTVSKLKLESKGIKSVKARVGNLVDFNKDVTIDDIINNVCKICNEPLEVITINDINKNSDVLEKAKKYRSWKWTYGECMGFNVKFEKKFNWGIIEIDFMVDSGVIRECNIFTDSLIIEKFKDLSKAFIGANFKGVELESIINNYIVNKHIKEDIISLFDEI